MANISYDCIKAAKTLVDALKNRNPQTPVKNMPVENERRFFKFTFKKQGNLKVFGKCNRGRAYR